MVSRPTHSAGTSSAKDAPEATKSPCLAKRRALGSDSPERFAGKALTVGSATWLSTTGRSAGRVGFRCDGVVASETCPVNEHWQRGAVAFSDDFALAESRS